MHFQMHAMQDIYYRCVVQITRFKNFTIKIMYKPNFVVLFSHCRSQYTKILNTHTLRSFQMTTATTAATTATTLAIVDELGLLKDQLEMIKEQIADREAQLKLLANGEKVTFTGEMYATTVSKPFDKKSVSWSKVAAELNAPAELVSKYTSVSTNATVTTTAIANVK